MAQASAEKLEHTGPAEKERVASVPQRAVGKYARAAFAQKKAVCPKYHIVREERVKVSKSRTLAREKGIRARAWRGKGGLYSERRQVPSRRARASKESLPRGKRRMHEQVSGRKSSPGRSAESWFHSKSDET